MLEGFHISCPISLRTVADALRPGKEKGALDDRRAPVSCVAARPCLHPRFPKLALDAGRHGQTPGGVPDVPPSTPPAQKPAPLLFGLGRAPRRYHKVIGKSLDWHRNLGPWRNFTVSKSPWQQSKG
ncbi:hypothetical protein SKAU_G00009120 [Synaphobranchus kaupii]|uniref:Uncharacterized protein n=1 Tax=Synaphobranchus kaupii TaxID=118154 RepID=A0A9Q1G9L9_SYNKA|nr:hypothetical protein SKAU_G00009120 [Synaphobranchus kaupii]